MKVFLSVALSFGRVVLLHLILLLREVEVRSAKACLPCVIEPVTRSMFATLRCIRDVLGPWLLIYQKLESREGKERMEARDEKDNEKARREGSYLVSFF